MPGNGQLMRSLRAGGGTGVAAAQELIRRAKSGTVSAAELKEVAKVIDSPELRDMFRGVAKDVSALIASGGSRVFRDVSSLRPDTSRLTDARTLPERFLADLKLVEQELMNHPGMTKEQKAERLFEFFESYAGRFAELAHGTAQARQAASAAEVPQQQQSGAFATTDTAGPQLAPPLTEAELGKALGQFDKALKMAGFEALKTDDGRTGLEAAREMLEAKTPEAQANARPNELTAPTWKDNAAPEPRTLKADVEKERRVAALDGKPQITPHLRVAGQKLEEAQAQDAAKKSSKSSGSDKVLGTQMLWNVMHLLRGDELDDVARRDAMNQLAVAAALIIIFAGIVVGLLVWM